MEHLGGKIKQAAFSYSGFWRCCCTRCLGEVWFRPFIIYSTECIMDTQRKIAEGWYMSYSFFCKPSLWTLILSLFILYSVKMGKESFLALLHYSEHNLYIKGEKWVLSGTSPSFSLLPCSLLNCQREWGAVALHPTWYHLVEGSCRRGLVRKRVKKPDVLEVLEAEPTADL